MRFPTVTTYPNELPGKQFTWEEFAKHNKRNDAYIAIRGNVYDITDFINRHPGGEDILLMAAGKDATQAFETYHQLGKPDMFLKKFYIGTLTSNELPTFPEISHFYRTIKTRADEYFEKNKIDSKNHIGIWQRYALIFGALIGSYYAQYYVSFVTSKTWLQVLCAVVLGFASAQVGLNPLHDATHFSVTHSPWVWRLLGATHDFFNGASYLVWQYQHAFGHHIYTNIAGADPDIRTADPDIRRIKPTQRWYSHYLNQHIYAPILYGLLAFKVRIQDINIMYISPPDGNIRINPVNIWHTSMFWGGKAFFVFYRIVLPLYFQPIAKVVLLFVISDLVTSYWLTLTFQANHVVEEVEWPLPDEKGFINQDWAEMQVVTTQDYAHDSLFWTSIVGSLNFQAVHHLLPQVSQHHYVNIAPIVKDTCKEFGVRFYYKDTYWNAVTSHVEHLRLLGSRPAHEKPE